MKNPFLIGNRIYLRPFEREDAPVLVGWVNDPEVRRYMLHHRPLTRIEEEGWLEKMARSETDVVLGIVVRESDSLIGAVALHHIDARNRHAALGITVGEKDEWNKGYGTEATALLVRHAFETLNLNRVWLHVYEYNARGIRAYEKVGFKKEGVLRQDTFREGRYWDTIVMGILRDEWGTAIDG